VTVPTYSEPAIGYRRWYVSAPDLWPGGSAPVGIRLGPWTPGVNTAQCLAGGRPHRAPEPSCTCGLHALHRVPTHHVHAFVIGAIAAWGDVMLHRDGFRAEHALIVALAETPHQPADKMRVIADRYQVPVVPLELLALEAERHGSSLEVAA
jgi:hypothetical protein